MADQIDHFVPGEGEAASLQATRLWLPIPRGVTQAYVEAYTEPGDAVLIPYCQGAAEVREVLAAGRLALAASFDPLAVLSVENALWPLPARDLDTAVARLGDGLKQGVPLRHSLGDLYATPCPACHRPASADHFVWDLELGSPIARWVHCAACGWDGQSALDAEDEGRMQAVPVRGMHFYYILDRAAPEEQDGPLRSRMETLLKLYSPRNLVALTELSMRIDALPASPTKRSLQMLLLECLESCSSLAPVPGTLPAPPAWAQPARYLERNVWLAFENAATRRRAQVLIPSPPLAASLRDYQQTARAPSAAAPAGMLCPATIRELRSRVAARSVRLIVSSPPPLDPAGWPFSCLWSAWLLGPAAGEPWRALLRQRSPDIAWYADSMSRSLAALDDLLCDGGRLALILTGQRPAVSEALSLAAARAHLGFAAIHQSGGDYRLELAPGLQQPSSFRESSVASPFAQIEQGIESTAYGAAVAAIRSRAEPVAWPDLHAAILRALAASGFLAAAGESLVSVPAALFLLNARIRAALDRPEFVHAPAPGIEGDLWWLSEGVGPGPALSDRVEACAHQALSRGGLLAPGAFSRMVCRELPGDLTPDPALLRACLQAYGQEAPDGRWRLRAEDWPEARRIECASIVDGLAAFGRRLGYRSAPRPPFDVAWYRAGQLHAVFAVRWQAVLGDLLPLARSIPGVQPYLVIPGGRSALVGLKLARNPHWQRLVEEANWRFVKYRHVRDILAQHDADEYTLRTIVGLDPIVERETVQLALF